MGQQNRNQSAIQRPWKVEGCLKELRKCLLQACNALSIDQVKFSTKMTKNLSLTFLCRKGLFFSIACSSIWICSKDLKKGREKGGFFSPYQNWLSPNTIWRKIQSFFQFHQYFMYCVKPYEWMMKDSNSVVTKTIYLQIKIENRIPDKK